MLILEWLLIAALAVVVHVSAMALAARVAGVPLVEIRFGVGPVLARFGKVRIGLLPLGGWAKLLDSRDERFAEATPAAQAAAFDRRPRVIRAAIPLAGAATVLLVALALLGHAGWTAFVRGFAQVFAGALSPLSAGQALLAAFVEHLRTQPFAASLGLYCAKLAAINLLPLPMFNGGDALLALAGVDRAPDGVRQRVQMAAMALILAVWLSWGVALVAFVLN